ncbi:MAG: hypothetical protein QXT45_05830 [Candidatus Bilamarchaeaceae archaeon]
MSVVTRVQLAVKDVEAINATANRLKYETSVNDNRVLLKSMDGGHSFEIDLIKNEILFDNTIENKVNEFRREYAVEAAKMSAHRAGYDVIEERSPSGWVKLTIMEV